MHSKNDLKRGLTIPEKSEKLAELFGVLTGDGYINFYSSKNDYIIEIAGHSIEDSEYFEYLSDLFFSLFNLKPKKYVRKNQNTAYLRLRSKGIFHFLEDCGFVRGKKEQIGIPSWIKKNNPYMARFIRGLVDTDGSLVLKKRYKTKPYYPVINIVSKSKPLITTTSSWLKTQNLAGWSGCEIKKDKRNEVITQNYRLEINGKKNLKKWLKLIGFSNKKHLTKIKKNGT